MTEHHEVLGLTFDKTEQIGRNLSFSGVQGSDVSAAIKPSAQKRRKYNEPSLKGPASAIPDSQNPLSLFNKVVNIDLNPKTVSFNLRETQTLRKHTNKKPRDYVNAEINVTVSPFEFGLASADQYREHLGYGQLIFAHDAWWKNSAELFENKQQNVFQINKEIERHQLTYDKHPHANSLGMINHVLKGIDANGIVEKDVLTDRYRLLGVLKGVTSRLYGTQQKLAIQKFGTVRDQTKLFNYWMLCKPQPSAGVHLWLTLCTIEIDADSYLQWLPCTTMHRASPTKEDHKESCLQKYLQSGESLVEVHQSLLVAKATNRHILKNPNHLGEIVKKLLRTKGIDEEVREKQHLSQLYLREAFLR